MEQAKFKKYTRIGLGALCVLGIGPLGFLMAFSILGITAAAASAVIAIALTMIVGALIDPFTQWVTNLKYKAMDAVVSRAPIETLYSEAQATFHDLEESSKAILAQSTEVEVMRAKVDVFVKRFGAEDERCVTWKKSLDDWEKILSHNVELFKKFKSDYLKFGDLIEAAEMEWDMSESERKLSKSFGRKDDFMRRLKTKTAFDAVQRASAESRARMKMALANNDVVLNEVRDKEPAHAINYTPQGKVDLGNIMDVQAVRVVREDAA